MTTSPPRGHDLAASLLQSLAPWRTAPVWHVGFSGGLDSTVLLHLLVQLAQRESLPPLNAIHVHHGLQTVADGWPEHCQQFCLVHGVPFHSVSVQVEPGASIEQAARRARYAAFSDALAPGEVLLTAQHRDDQAETLLFRLMRGAGVRGLAAMPAQRVLGRGHLLRPLLEVPRVELERYARAQGLSWIEDPSNDDLHYSRNFLRRKVMPLLTTRWPQAAASMARTASHLAEASQLLDELAEQDLSSAQPATSFDWLGLPVLALDPLRQLSDARQRNALRHWLSRFTRLPDTDHWVGWQNLRDAAEGARPVWRLADGELHRTRGHLWWISGTWLNACQGALNWVDPGQALSLPGNGHVTLKGEPPEGPLTVRYRDGTDIMNIPGRGRRDLKRLLNERGVPSFVRGRLPLLYRDDQLLAVAGLSGLDGSTGGSWRFQWVAPTSDQSLS